MKLLVISHTPHYRQAGQIVAWGPTVRELDYLASRVDELVHLAILHPGMAPGSSLPYGAVNIRPVLLPPGGGASLWAKMGVLKLTPAYLGEIRRQIQGADLVQVRCPAHISLLALLTLGITARLRYRWFKFAGNWRPEPGHEPTSYRVQRWLLAHNWGGGPVTVNGRWPDQPAHIYSLDNPCLTQAEVAQAQRLTAGKRLSQPVRCLFVGRLEEAKGLGQALQILADLRRSGIELQLDILGDGPERTKFENQARALGIDSRVCFHGLLPRAELVPFYTQAHFLLLPSRASEGWPKVLSEAMAYGAVPLASDISSIPQILGESGCGVALPGTAVDRFVTATLEYLGDPERWQVESQRGQRASERFTYAAYGAALNRMFEQVWGAPLLR
jgi:glycosyltransferase involved in cell wall biosynthesis